MEKMPSRTEAGHENVEVQIEEALKELAGKVKAAPENFQKLSAMSEDGLKKEPTRWQQIQSRYENIRDLVSYGSMGTAMGGLVSAMWDATSVKGLDPSQMDPQQYANALQSAEFGVNAGGSVMLAAIAAFIVGNAANLINRRLQRGY
jgi:hypothetical protein